MYTYIWDGKGWDRSLLGRRREGVRKGARKGVRKHVCKGVRKHVRKGQRVGIKGRAYRYSLAHK